MTRLDMVAIDELKLDQWANNMLIDNPIWTLLESYTCRPFRGSLQVNELFSCLVFTLFDIVLAKLILWRPCPPQSKSTQWQDTYINQVHVHTKLTQGQICPRCWNLSFHTLCLIKATVFARHPPHELQC